MYFHFGEEPIADDNDSAEKEEEGFAQQMYSFVSTGLGGLFGKEESEEGEREQKQENENIEEEESSEENPKGKSQLANLFGDVSESTDSEDYVFEEPNYSDHEDLIEDDKKKAPLNKKKEILKRKKQENEEEDDDEDEDFCVKKKKRKTKGKERENAEEKEMEAEEEKENNNNEKVNNNNNNENENDDDCPVLLNNNNNNEEIMEDIIPENQFVIPEEEQALLSQVCKVIEDLNCYMVDPDSDVLWFKRVLKSFRSIDEDKMHWYPWGCPPLAPLVNITLNCDDVEAKKTAESIVSLFQEGMKPSVQKKIEENQNNGDDDDDSDAVEGEIEGEDDEDEI
jgi:hypothetical protein